MCAPKGVLVANAASLVSAGTERMVVEFSAASPVQKARLRPDLVHEVVAKARREGILSALHAVQTRLDQPITLGYSSAGVVVEADSDSPASVGDRVACAGGGYAVHAEVVSVPHNLVVRIPDCVDFEAASFVTLGAIALQGIRLAEVRLGEVVAVIGLGLIGQLTIQLLKAAGCTVVGMDPQPQRARLALKMGADGACTSEGDLRSQVLSRSSGHGADAVIIAADARSDRPVELAGELARDRGTVVAVGAVGLRIPRGVYYEKELQFRLSRSYGPGRYDPQYEEKGLDYPIGYVRWTERRNMEAFVHLLADRKVDVTPLISHRFSIDEAPKAYQLITGRTKEPFLGVIITYPGHVPVARSRGMLPATIRLEAGHHASEASHQPVRVGLLGAGNFAMGTLLPALKGVRGVELVGVCARTGVSAARAAKKFGFRYCTTDENALFEDPEINTIVVATRHHLHARQVISALRAGKHVHCEKPLGLNEEELLRILGSLRDSSAILTVGYNRRFSAMVQRLKRFFSDTGEPLVLQCRVNAGPLAPTHWVQDPDQGGGRVMSEVCHFVDLLTFLAGSLPVRVQAWALPSEAPQPTDNLIVNLEFSGGSLGSIAYLANGDRSFAKERVEVFGGGRVAVLDDFRRLELVQNGQRRVYTSLLRQDKGHRGQWEAFVHELSTGHSWPIPLVELIATTVATLRIAESLKTRRPIEVDVREFVATLRAH